MMKKLFILITTILSIAILTTMFSSQVSAQQDTCDALITPRIRYPAADMTVLLEPNGKIPLLLNIGHISDYFTRFEFYPKGKDCSISGSVCKYNVFSEIPADLTPIPGYDEYTLTVQTTTDFCYPKAPVSALTTINFKIANEMKTPSPSATPAPTDPPHPTSPPIAPLCAGISRDISSPKLGDKVTFTCGLFSVATKYEFRYKLGQQAFQTLSISSTKPNMSNPLTISSADKYTVQCRPCIGTTCAPWDVLTN